MKWIHIVLWAIGIALFFALLKKRQDEVERTFQQRFLGVSIRLLDKYALYVARASDGASHIRGIGYLVLTDKELYFKRQLDKMVIAIPIASIQEVGETMRLAGQCPGKRMLKVDFHTEEGEADAIAWCVKDREKWIHELTLVTTT